MNSNRLTQIGIFTVGPRRGPNDVTISYNYFLSYSEKKNCQAVVGVEA